MRLTLPNLQTQGMYLLLLMAGWGIPTYGAAGLTSAPVPTSDIPDSTQNKWILQRGDTLYWAIHSTATFDDIYNIKQALKEVGATLTINTLKYDPLQKFVTALILNVHIASGQDGAGEEFKNDYTPIRGYSGFISRRSLGMGQLPPEPLLTQLQEDYKKALVLKEQNKVGYQEDQLKKEFHKKGIYLLYNYMTTDNLEGVYAANILKEEGVGKSPENTLLITDLNNEAVFYLNAYPTTRKDLGRLSFDTIQKVNTGQDRNGKRYIMVYTK